MIFEQIVPLDVADEIQVEPFAEFEGFKRQFVAFDVVRLFTGRNTGMVRLRYNGLEEQIARIQPETAYGAEAFF